MRQDSRTSGKKAEMTKKIRNLLTILFTCIIWDNIKMIFSTARSLHSLGVSIAGKTGTSEYSDDKEKTHSWFIGFSNVENPDIALAVVIENSDSTGDVATDIAEEIFKAYYAK